MKTTLTITSKGQTTIPAAIRRKLGIGKDGGTLEMDFNENKNELIVSKPVTIDEISARLTKLIKPGTKPLRNVDEYYQKHREPRL